jgi:hypothetical protein
MKTLTIVVFLISFSAFSQTKGVVKDSLSGKPIPFVNIWVENENIGGTSEDNGEFSIHTSEKSKDLIFSSLGYQTKKVPISNSMEVVLKPISFLLDEVLISNPKNINHIVLGDSNKQFYLPEPQVVPWILARKFNLNQSNTNTKYIKSITFFTKNQIDGAVFRVRVFSVNEENMPQDDMLFEDVIVETKRGKQKTVVNLDKYKIQIPTTGVIIGFESLLMEKNKYKQKFSNEPINYAPHILYQYIDNEESYTFRNARWIRQLFSMYSNKGEKNKVLAPAINLTLTN